jgi:pimeloyl-ACP methyl ester carboxylesterase
MYPAGVPGVRAHFVTLASGGRVRAVEAGPRDGQAVVIVPGWACGAWMFRETLSGLAAAGYRAIAVELKGHGLSDKPESPEEYTLESMRDHVLSILDGLGLSSAVLVGHSMGASIAAHAASVAPDRVTALVLIAPVGFAGVRGMTLFRAITPRNAVPLLSRMATRLVVWVMLVIVYRLKRPTRRDVDEFRAPTQFPGFVLALRHLLHRFDWNAEFPPVPVPRLVIVATRDHLSPWRDAERYAGDIAPVVIEGAGHVIVDEAPGEVNKALVRFFQAQFGPHVYFDSR